MNYTIRNAILEDLPRIEEIYSYARKFMTDNGNPDQWGKVYPPRELLAADIAGSVLYVITEEEEIHGVFYFSLGKDPTYAEIFEGSWRSQEPYGTIHRIAGDGSGGVLKSAVDFAQQAISHLRIDTHRDNLVMQKALVKQGFKQRGIIYVEDGTERIAYDKLV